MGEPPAANMEHIRTIAAILLTATVLVFAAQNLDGVEVHFLIWDLPANVAVLVLVPFAAGLVLARLDTGLNYLVKWMRTRRESAPAPAEAVALPAGETPEPAEDPNGETSDEVSSDQAVER
jgi:uncharacterized integral membrane protein